jgi:chromosome segregation ATPase
MLVHGLDELTVNRNELQEKINQASSQTNSGSSLLSQIDAWQENTIQKVKQTAQQARQQVLKIINSKREDITKQFQTLSKEMKELRETEDVLEQDLSRLKKQIEQLHKGLGNLSQSLTVELNMKHSEQIAWHHLICIEDKSLSSQIRRSSQLRLSCDLRSSHQFRFLFFEMSRTGERNYPEKSSSII